MKEEAPDSQEGQSTAQEAWRNVGEQMKTLGQSLSAALRLAWEDEAFQQHKEAIQQGFENLAKEVSRAIEDGIQSSEVKQARQHAEKVMEDVRSAGEQTIQEARPHLVSALRRLTNELEAIIETLEQATPTTDQDAQSAQAEDSSPDQTT